MEQGAGLREERSRSRSAPTLEKEAPREKPSDSTRE
jgi:hypothetical protein